MLQCQAVLHIVLALCFFPGMLVAQPMHHIAPAGLVSHKNPGGSRFQDMLGNLTYSKAMIRVAGSTISCSSTGLYPFTGSGSWTTLYCLNTWEGKKEPGSLVLLFPCDENDAGNQFDFYEFPSNDASKPKAYNIVSRINYLCLDAGDSPGGQVTLQPCTSSPSQQFYLKTPTQIRRCTPPLYKYFQIQSASSLQCMTVGDTSPYDGASVVFTACASTATPQQTFFPDYFYGTYLGWSPPPPPSPIPRPQFQAAYIRSAASALRCSSKFPFYIAAPPWALRCFNSWGGNNSPGDTVNLFDCDMPPLQNELWKIALAQSDSDGLPVYKIINPNTEDKVCIDAGDTGATPYQLTQQTCSDATSQQFYLQILGQVAGCPSTYLMYQIRVASTGQCLRTLSASSGSSPSFGTCSGRASDPTQTFFIDTFYSTKYSPPPPYPPGSPPPPPAPSPLLSRALLRVAGSALSCTSNPTRIVGSGSYRSLLCLYDPTAVPASGGAVTMRTCNLPPPATQVWNFQYVAETYPPAYLIVSSNGQLCLDAGDTTLANYRLTQAACNGSPRQQFILRNPNSVTNCDATYLYYQLQVASSEECLSIPSATIGQSPRFVDCTDSGDPQQTFFIDGFWPTYLGLRSPPPVSPSPRPPPRPPPPRPPPPRPPPPRPPLPRPPPPRPPPPRPPPPRPQPPPPSPPPRPVQG
eukprot:jgi/Botrbrau1/9469/Bobra.0252s0090.1